MPRMPEMPEALLPRTESIFGIERAVRSIRIRGSAESIDPTSEKGATLAYQGWAVI
jgi:hypothetical protein